MNTTPATPPAPPAPTGTGTGTGNPRQALARAAGMAAFVYGYPLTESIRTCRLQTVGSASAEPRAPINRLFHITSASTHRDRDIVTPANDLLYTTAWINLADGPMLLTLPAARRHADRYFVAELLDVYTENFQNLGLRQCDPAGETVMLVGPAGLAGGSAAAASASAVGPFGLRDGPAGQPRIVACPTNLVWMIARVLVGDGDDDLQRARQMQADFRLEPAPGCAASTRAPLSVSQWHGEPTDAMADCLESGQPASQVAPRFYVHLCRALADAPGRPEDAGLIAWFGSAGLRGGYHFDWNALEPAQRDGLIEGFADGVALVAASTRGRHARPWVLATRNGRYGSEYLLRAATAYIGLGALDTDETLYGASHFDAKGQPLNGGQTYSLHFAADQMPPAKAFWSVTLYDADRFLYGNEINRHSIGDRTPGLHRDSEGGLTLIVGHRQPTETSNWLPAPAGPFYLVVRLYHPREDVRGWRMPALQALAQA